MECVWSREFPLRQTRYRVAHCSSNSDNCRSSSGDNNGDLLAHELGSNIGQVFAFAVCPAILDRNGAAVDPSEVAQPLHEGSIFPPLAGRSPEFHRHGIQMMTRQAL